MEWNQFLLFIFVIVPSLVHLALGLLIAGLGLGGLRSEEQLLQVLFGGASFGDATNKLLPVLSPSVYKLDVTAGALVVAYGISQILVSIYGLLVGGVHFLNPKKASSGSKPPNQSGLTRCSYSPLCSMLGYIAALSLAIIFLAVTIKFLADFNTDIKQKVRSDVQNKIQMDYAGGNNGLSYTPITHLMQVVETQKECCGYTGVEDYTTAEGWPKVTPAAEIISVPITCCRYDKKDVPDSSEVETALNLGNWPNIESLRNSSCSRRFNQNTGYGYACGNLIENAIRDLYSSVQGFLTASLILLDLAMVFLLLLNVNSNRILVNMCMRVRKCLLLTQVVEPEENSVVKKTVVKLKNVYQIDEPRVKSVLLMEPEKRGSMEFVSATEFEVSDPGVHDDPRSFTVEQRVVREMDEEEAERERTPGKSKKKKKKKKRRSHVETSPPSINSLAIHQVMSGTSAVLSKAGSRFLDDGQRRSFYEDESVLRGTASAKHNLDVTLTERRGIVINKTPVDLIAEKEERDRLHDERAQAIELHGRTPSGHTHLTVPVKPEDKPKPKGILRWLRGK